MGTGWLFSPITSVMLTAQDLKAVGGVDYPYRRAYAVSVEGIADRYDHLGLDRRPGEGRGIPNGHGRIFIEHLDP